MSQEINCQDIRFLFLFYFFNRDYLLLFNFYLGFFGFGFSSFSVTEITRQCCTTSICPAGGSVSLPNSHLAKGSACFPTCIAARHLRGWEDTDGLWLYRNFFAKRYTVLNLRCRYFLLEILKWGILNCLTFFLVCFNRFRVCYEVMSAVSWLRLSLTGVLNTQSLPFLTVLYYW